MLVVEGAWVNMTLEEALKIFREPTSRMARVDLWFTLVLAAYPTS